MKLYGSTAAGILLLVTGVPGFGQLQTLTYRPADAAYSTALDRLVSVNGGPNQLHLYDPETRNDVALALGYAPSSLALSADGRFAAVGHDQFISWVDLTGLRVVRVIGIGIDVAALAVARDFVYALPRGSGALRYASVSTGVVSVTGITFYTTPGALVALKDGSALYSADLGSTRLNVAPTGAVTPRYGPFVQPCNGPLNLAEDSRLVNRCSFTYSVNSDPALDLQYRGRFGVQIRHLTSSASRVEVAVLPYTDSLSPTLADSELLLYRSEYLDEFARFTLPQFVSSNKTGAGLGRFVFYSADSSKLIVVMQADPAAGFLNDYGVAVFNFGASCPATFASATGSVAAIGGTSSVAVSNNFTCLWQATSTSAWLKILSNSTASGAAGLKWYAQPNPTAAARSGTLTIAGQTFTVTQGGRAAASDLAVLPYQVMDAEYDKQLDRLVIVSAAPNQLHLYDGLEKLETLSADLPLAPRHVSVSPDGRYAAVSHDAWVTRVNLTTGLVDRVYPVPDAPTDVVLSATHLFSIAGFNFGNLDAQIRAIDLATGAQTSKGRGTRGVLSVDGTSLFTDGNSLGTSRWKVVAGALVLNNSSSDFNSGTCDYLQRSADGLRLLTGCGSALRLSDTKDQDLKYGGTLTGLTRLTSIVHLPTRGLLFAAPREPYLRASEVQKFSYQDLGYLSKTPLPEIGSGGPDLFTFPTFVFASADESKVMVLLQSTPGSGQNSAGSVDRVYSFAVDSAPVCTFTLSSLALSLPQSGGTSARVQVNTPPACSWTVISNAAWLVGDATINKGPGSFVVSAGINPGNSQRAATISIAGQSLAITQASVADCSFSVPSSLIIGAEWFYATLPVDSAFGCAFTISGNVPWLGFYPHGTGISVSPNETGVSRTGTLTVSGKQVTITQLSKSVSECKALINQELINLPAEGKSGTLTLTFTGTCPATWSSVYSPRWLQIYPISGTTAIPQTLNYTVYPTFGSARGSLIQLSTGPGIGVGQNSTFTSQDERFVGLVYFAFLGRVAAPSELAFQVNALTRGLSRADLVTSFLNSNEFNFSGRFIAGLYVGLLNRDADFGGWLFQRNALATGFANQNQLVSNFLGSPEWVLKFGNPANSEFVRLLYRYILLREGTPAEVNFQVNALNAGSTRVALAAAFLNTTEFRIGTGARLTAFLLHATLLSRDGLAAETASKIARLNASVPAKTLVQEILDNPEFGARTSGN